MPESYSSQYREMVLTQVRAGRTVRDLADGLEVSAATIFRWRKQDRIDAGDAVGLSSQELFPIVKQLGVEGHGLKSACRVLQIAPSGSLVWRHRPPSDREIRRVWLTDVIVQTGSSLVARTGGCGFRPNWVTPMST